jgi:multiple sugar transport system permease protein
VPWFQREMRASQFAFFMNVPTLLCLGLVLAYPVVYAAYLSVHRVGLAQLRRGEFPFNGLENYSRVLEDPLFWVALKNTLIFTAITVSSEIVLAVLIALLINQTSVWTSRLTRFLILLPYAIPPIANGLIWAFLQARAGSGAGLFFGLYIIATTVLFGSVKSGISISRSSTG